ncbi:hypothetical protein NOV72_02360 [Caballeronia novacaledonica]|uniref:PF07007 family protein n=2 Tax=Caballeronia novacaledonica TaxID=1544861 RepID=A0A2U3I4N5_9BURK|nr:hypothetical protein NOV72_02360 [Caballeronia novacaledonica]
MSLTFFLVVQMASAVESYIYTGVAKVGKNDASPHLFLPSNPAYSGSASISEAEFTYSNNYGDLHCSVPVDKHANFSFDVIAAQNFGTSEDFEKFMFKKFGLRYNEFTDSYLLGGNAKEDCRAFKYSKIYTSKESIVVWSEDWMYVFRHQNVPVRDATRALECQRARSNVERMTCANRELMVFDAAVNLGFVEMQDSFSKEISAEDPVRVDQINWLRDVRNNCVDTACLFNAYKARVAYFKKRLSARYPSYPQKVSNPQYD